MHSETDWLDKSDGGEGAASAYKFYMRPDPDMREFLGPIETVDDPITNRPMRRRRTKIAMMRGAGEEHMREVWVYLDPVPHIRLDKEKPLQGWYGNAHPESIRERKRPCYTEAVLTEPYGGYCPVGCSFCYVNAGGKGYRGTGLMTVPIHYGDGVRRQLSKMRKSAAGYFQSFSDPFLSLEDYYGNTQSAANAFHELGLPVFFLSRLQYPGWALDLLTKNKYSYAQKSLNCADPDDWLKLSPGALPLPDHLDEIREMRRRGIYVSIQCNPIVPGIVNHEDVENLFDLLAEAGANHVIVKFVEAGFSWAPAMAERITQRFGDNRAARFRELFTQNIGSQRTIDEDYRREGHERYRRRATKLGLSYAVCFEFKRERDAKGTILPGSGISMGPDYMTSEQCHGHRVPMYTRNSTHSASGKPTMFREVEECPPSGCLSCSSQQPDNQPACGNIEMGAAKAMRSADYKEPVR